MHLEKKSLLDPVVDKFVSDYGASPFSGSVWCRVLEKGFNKDVSYYCLMENGHIVLVLPAILLNLKLVNILYANMPYGGFIGDTEYITHFLELLENKLRRERIHQIRITRTFFDDFSELEGYRIQKGYQHVLNLEGLCADRLINEYKPVIRRNIRKAERSGISIRRIGGREEISRLFRLYRDTMKRHNANPIWTKGTLYAIYDLLIPEGKASILFAELSGNTISGMIVIYSKDITSYFLGASDFAYLSLRPNDLLFHTAIRESVSAGKRYFDFMTCNIRDKGLIQFKEKWGAERHSFYIFEKDLDLLRSAVWRQIWKIANTRMGIFFLRACGKI